MLRRAWPLLASLVLIAGCPGPDAPPDGGGDAATDAPSCRDASDCDDGLFCNGAETCEAGRCAAGEAVLCDDGLECTTDRCSERREACEALPFDGDGDGAGVIGCADGDDCDDADPERFPGNFEVCDPDGHDEDCNLATRGSIDEDGDGFESAACCNPTEAGPPSCGDDCNDAVAAVSPRGIELCNLRDDDCDGLSDLDEGLAIALFVDADRDGYGDEGVASVMACASQAGYSANGGDCDDASIARSPGQPELCDGMDNDCDPNVDEDAGPVPWYADLDGDGFGDRSDVVASCVPIADRSLLPTDCDDAAPGRNPGQAELCNGIDDDCNGLPDAPAPGGTLEDDDLDGLADLACAGGTDCDDLSAAVGAGRSERCDGRDNDCDGSTDEGVEMAVFYADRDGDGYGSLASGAFVGCGAPASFVAVAGDCADADPGRYPGADEECDGRDDDCDGSSDEEPASTSCDRYVGTAGATAASCRSGACALTCELGLGDCDADPSTGCETNILSELDHCGACGRACEPTGVSFLTCSGGTCQPTCLPERRDCDRNGVNGCEVDVANDPRNCGDCGARCPSGPNATATCEASTCRVTCSAGFSDCDGEPTNGCETAGGCITCPPGGQDCDGDGVCEDLLADLLNCGSCGRACGLGGVCFGGSCDGIWAIAIGDRHTCALRGGGQVICWGQNDEGQVAPSRRATMDDRASRSTPAIVAEVDDAVVITAGRRHTCALRVSGRVSCWGSNANGQLGVAPSATTFYADVLLPGAVSDIEAGGDHTCAIVGADIYCWGANARGESDPLMPGGTRAPLAIGELAAGRPARFLALGDEFTCYGTDVEVANCFGNVPGVGPRSFGTGAGWDTEFSLPFTGSDVALLEAGGTHVCVGLRSGAVHCRGLNTVGQLGDGTTTARSGVVEATELFGARSLWLGRDTTCARVAFDRLRCVGGNEWGELGRGTSGPATFGTSAAAPMGLSRVRVLSRGGEDGHVCAVDLAGRTYCWGHNTNVPPGMEHRLGLDLDTPVVPVPTALVSLGY